MSEQEIRVTFAGQAKVKAEYKGQVILTDQPVKAGGQGTAPSPFDLFLASIATCAGYYVLSFLKQRQLPLDRVYLTVLPERTPDSKLVENIKIDIHLPGSFPEKYREAAVRAADQCLVKAHLASPPRIEIRTVRD
ncbi:MAG: OsmC family protein [Acidobacteriota bacterium]|nr:OsmC family protein [Acidobacteriota bacterium]